jgi:hypothetical protein
LASVDLGTGAITFGDDVIGEPQGFARDGSFALFIRTDPTTYVRELVRRPSDGSRETVLATGELGGLSMIEGDQQAVLSSWDKSGSMQSFTVIGLSSANDVLASLKTDPTTSGAVLKNPF